MSRHRSSRDRFLSDINVTPFVDVMLVLLIIFMVAAPMMTQGVDVELPAAETTSLPAADTEQLLITVDKTGDIFINNFSVEAAQLTEKLKAILALRQDRRVYLRADKQVEYGTVVQVMAAIKNAGVDNLGMVTVPYEENAKRNAQ